MDGLLIITFTAVVIGVAVVVVTLVSIGRIVNKGAGRNDTALKNVEDSIKEADEAAEELNKLAGSVLEELDKKYQEVLFLYNLIDEKKKELAAQYKNQGLARPNEGPADVTGRDNKINHPKKREILELHKMNAPVADIAKTLGVGQGEVKLVLGLTGRG